MTVTELLESIRRVEVRTNRLVNDTMGGAYLSGFKGRGMDCGRFSLTPALSRWEKENCFQLFGESTAGFCSTVQKFLQSANGRPLSQRERTRVRENAASFVEIGNHQSPIEN